MLKIFAEMIRLAIYKKIVITLVLVAIAVVHKVDCGPDHSDVVIDEKAPSGDVTRGGGGSEESRQMLVNTIGLPISLFLIRGFLLSTGQSSLPKMMSGSC